MIGAVEVEGLGLSGIGGQAVVPPEVATHGGVDVVVHGRSLPELITHGGSGCEIGHAMLLPGAMMHGVGFGGVDVEMIGGFPPQPNNELSCVRVDGPTYPVLVCNPLGANI